MDERMSFQAREAVTVIQKAPEEAKAENVTPVQESSPETAPDGLKSKKTKEV